MRRIALLLVVFALVGSIQAEGADSPEATADAALELGLVDEIETTLVQIPVRFSGKGDLYRLSPDDFEVWLGERRIENFDVDFLDQQAFRRIAPVTAGGSRGASPTWREVSGTVSVNSECGSSTRTITARMPVLSSASGTSSTSRAPRRPARSGLDSDQRYSVTSLVSIPDLDAPSPALRVMTRSKFLRIAGPGGGPAASANRLRPSLIPIGFRDGAYVVRAQLDFHRPEALQGTWDLQITIRSGPINALVWGRIDATEGASRLVLQDEFDLPPGDYGLSAVAVERGSGESHATTLHGRLPQVGPFGNRAELGSVALLQQADGAILKAGAAQAPSRVVALGGDESLRPGRDAVLLTALCRRPRIEGPLSIERAIGSSVSTTAVEASDEPCLVLRDSIPAHRVAEATVYRLRLVDGAGVLAETQRSLRPALAAPAAQPTPVVSELR